MLCRFCSSTPGRESVATISLDQVKEIVEQKKDDLNAVDMDQACKIIAGTARSMGIMVEGA